MLAIIVVLSVAETSHAYVSYHGEHGIKSLMSGWRGKPICSMTVGWWDRQTKTHDETQKARVYCPE